MVEQSETLTRIHQAAMEEFQEKGFSFTQSLDSTPTWLGCSVSGNSENAVCARINIPFLLVVG